MCSISTPPTSASLEVADDQALLEFASVLAQPDPSASAMLYFLLIEQKRVRLEVLERGKGWQQTVLDARLELPEFGFTTDVANLYRGTPLARPPQT